MTYEEIYNNTKLSEHEAILEIKDRLEIFEPKSKDDLESDFYGNWSIDHILEELNDFNVLIGELHVILNSIKKE